MKKLIFAILLIVFFNAIKAQDTCKLPTCFVYGSTDLKQNGILLQRILTKLKAGITTTSTGSDSVTIVNSPSVTVLNSAFNIASSSFYNLRDSATKQFNKLQTALAGVALTKTLMRDTISGLDSVLAGAKMISISNFGNNYAKVDNVLINSGTTTNYPINGKDTYPKLYFNCLSSKLLILVIR